MKRVNPNRRFGSTRCNNIQRVRFNYQKLTYFVCVCRVLNLKMNGFYKIKLRKSTNSKIKTFYESISLK